jgi:hypothetical protein
MFKILNSLRILRRLNIIASSLLYSSKLMSIFFLGLMTLTLSLVPLAQALWGTNLEGYKSLKDAAMSVLMITYAKGNLDLIIEMNSIWSFLFLLVYYFLVLFFMTAAFHHIQFESLKNIVLLQSLPEENIIQMEKSKQVRVSIFNR